MQTIELPTHVRYALWPPSERQSSEVECFIHSHRRELGDLWEEITPYLYRSKGKKLASTYNNREHLLTRHSSSRSVDEQSRPKSPASLRKSNAARTGAGFTPINCISADGPPSGTQDSGYHSGYRSDPTSNPAVSSPALRALPSPELGCTPRSSCAGPRTQPSPELGSSPGWHPEPTPPTAPTQPSPELGLSPQTRPQWCEGKDLPDCPSPISKAAPDADIVTRL